MFVSTSKLAVVALIGTGLVVLGPPGSAAGSGRCAQPGSYQLPTGSETVHLDPADFTAEVDHPYWPMQVGTIWRYVERDGRSVQRATVRVTGRTKVIAGIRARVVRDVVREGGEIVEATDDWYAQDSGGMLWYLGEATAEYEDGEVVSTAGSWEHGVDGAQAGVILPARLRRGCRYREEHLAGQAEDRAEILSTRVVVDTETGRHRRVVQTANTTPLEPGLLENKLYAPGIGPVVEVDLAPEPSTTELVWTNVG